MVLPDVQYWEFVVPSGLHTLCECHQRGCGAAADLDSQEINILEKTLILAGRRVLEKELERHRKMLNGPKNTAKQIEAKQSWINRETKRIEAEDEKVAEMQETLRLFTRKSRNSERIWRRRRTGAMSCPRRAWRKYETSNDKKYT